MNNMNPYESSKVEDEPTLTSAQHLDRGVLGIAVVMIFGCLMSIIGMAVPAIRDFLMPRFGWIGLFVSVNSLIFIGFWMKKPTRSAILAASFMTCVIAVINGVTLFRTGTVDVVQNVFHDRLASAWIWSVGTYLFAGGYFAFVAFRMQGKPPQAAAH